MVRHTCLLMIVAAVGIAGGLAAQPAQAQARPAGPSDLFYNYYVPAGSPAGVGAAMYPAPRPTPPWVGYTYFTYQPLMPQEFLYEHRRVYRTPHPEDHTVTRTTVTYNHRSLCPLAPTVMWGVSVPHTPPARPVVNCGH